MIISLDLSRFDAFAPTDPYLRYYKQAIMDAQSGQHDNPQKQFRYFILYQAALQACALDPSLDMVECGCFRGHSTLMLARVLSDNSFRGTLHVFDSFEGLSDFRAEDESEFYSTPEQKDRARKHFTSNFDHVAALLAAFPFVKLYRGWIPERFEDAPVRPLSLLSIDVDLYAPTLDSFREFWPRVMHRGMAFLDDYGYRTFPGARMAIDQILAEDTSSILLRMPFGSALAIKQVKA